MKTPQQELLNKHAAELQANLTSALRKKYKEVVREIAELGDRWYSLSDENHMQIAAKLKAVVQEEVNKYLEKVGLPCRVDYKIAEQFETSPYVLSSMPQNRQTQEEKYNALKQSLALGKPIAQPEDINKAADDLMKVCNEMFNSVYYITRDTDMDYKRNFDSGILTCVKYIMRDIPQFVVSAALLWGSAVAGMSAYSGTAVALGALTIPPIGVAVLGAVALAAGAYAMKGVIQDLFLGRSEIATRNYMPHEYHVPGKASILSSQLADKYYGMSATTRKHIDTASAEIAQGEDSQAIKVAKALVEYCGKFEQKGQSAGR